MSLNVIGTGLSRANNTRARVADMQASIVDRQLMMMAPEEMKKKYIAELFDLTMDAFAKKGPGKFEELKFENKTKNWDCSKEIEKEEGNGG